MNERTLLRQLNFAAFKLVVSLTALTIFKLRLRHTTSFSRDNTFPLAGTMMLAAVFSGCVRFELAWINKILYQFVRCGMFQSEVHCFMVPLLHT